ncbi:MAG: type II secretion system protein [Firmicutes bacterium]|nr:type II secretion system protein [Candidatus Colivicinus equi]
MIKKISEKREQKGFTLVELLVVIAILAVLATVSVVGYTSFIGKANDSNALTECKQAEEIVLSELISFGDSKNGSSGETSDGTVTIDGVKFGYDMKSGKISIDASSATVDDITTNFKAKFTDAANLTGSFLVSKKAKDGEIVYVTQNKKGYATWASTNTPIAGAPSGWSAPEAPSEPEESVEG